MLKIIEEEYTPFECVIKDALGNEKKVKSKPLSTKAYEELRTLINNKEISNSKSMLLQMALYFGGDEKDYEKLTITILEKVLVAFTEHVQANPTTPQGT